MDPFIWSPPFMETPQYSHHHLWKPPIYIQYTYIYIVKLIRLSCLTCFPRTSSETKAEPRPFDPSDMMFFNGNRKRMGTSLDTININQMIPSGKLT